MSFTRRDAAATGSSSKSSTLGVSCQTTSTGIPSLDDILGGGLPLGTVLLVLGTDLHTNYLDLIHRYFVAEGLASGHNVSIVGENAKEIVSNCMWMQTPGTAVENEDGSDPSLPPGEVKIAWRYEKLKQFQTSVPYNKSTGSNRPFELTTRIPDLVIKEALASERLQYIGVTQDWNYCLRSLESIFLKTRDSPTVSSAILRLSIPLLGSPEWGDLLPSDLLRFLHQLRALMRRDPTVASRVCACISLPVHLSEESFGGIGWMDKLAWLSDGYIRLQSFAADPSLSAMFPGQHGLVHIKNLPVPFSLVPPSDKFSELRGLSKHSSSDTGGGENNLAFRCTRKRFLIETLHLDIEGGVSERRTTVPMNGSAAKSLNSTALSSVPIVREETSLAPPEMAVGNKKKKKKVNFQSDRPDIYDF